MNLGHDSFVILIGGASTFNMIKQSGVYGSKHKYIESPFLSMPTPSIPDLGHGNVDLVVTFVHSKAPPISALLMIYELVVLIFVLILIK